MKFHHIAIKKATVKRYSNEIRALGFLRKSRKAREEKVRYFSRSQLCKYPEAVLEVEFTQQVHGANGAGARLHLLIAFLMEKTQKLTLKCPEIVYANAFVREGETT